MAEQRAAPDPEAIENSRQRGFEVVQRFRAGVERRQRIDQNDLAVEPREMIAEERPNHHVLIGLVAPDHHRPQRAVGCHALSRQIERRKGQCRRTGEVARHQEAARRQQAHGKAFVAAGAQIVRELPRRCQRCLFVRLRLRGPASQDARAIALRASRGDRPATTQDSPPTIARNFFGAAANPAAIRRGSRRYRALASALRHFVADNR